MSKVLPLFVFPSSTWWSYFNFGEKTVIEIHENWVKQSFRNKYEIAGPNGRQSLSIPTVKSTRKQLIDVQISYAEDWVTNHLRSVKTAYNRSPFYEHYAHHFEEILNKKPKYLVDLNLKTVQFGMDRLHFDKEIETTKEFNMMPEVMSNVSKARPYNQVFETKYDFIPNLSFLDVLFNCGPESGSVMY
ncbi:MAG: hypothetical protein ACI8SE_000882 [Bacteroidia bacterium]|jgi:hypothetical protein